MTGAPGSDRGRILIEGHNLMLPSGTGIATYARQLGSALRGLGYDTELLVGSTSGFNRADPVLTEIAFFDAEFPPTLGRQIAAEWRRLSVLPLPAKSFALPRFSQVVAPTTERFAGFSAVRAVPHLMVREMQHFKRYGRPLTIAVEPGPSLFHATRPAPIQVRGMPNIYTLHDVVPLRLPYTTLDDKKLYLGIIRELCHRADHIVTVSEFSRQDIIKLTGIPEHRITNTYQAVKLPERLAGRDRSTVARDLAALFQLDIEGYFLFVGAIEPKKNLTRLIEAYAASGVNRPLVIAGGAGWMNEKVIELIESDRFLSYAIEGRRIRPERLVKRIPYLPLDHLVTLIRGARALLFPSLYEGFGLPVLEAMSLGTPVMTSNVSSLPEIAGEAARLVDPYDTEEISAAIRELDADADLRRELAARGKARVEAFSPEKYQARLDRLYRSVLGR